MDRATPKMRAFAECLIAFEKKVNKDGSAHAPAPSVLAKMRPQLAMLMGNAGFAALLSRALAISTVQVPELQVVKVKMDGSLEGWDETQLSAGRNLKVKTDPGVLLVAQVLELLTAFIGENLTLHLARDIWPKLPHTELELGIGAKNE